MNYPLSPNLYRCLIIWLCLATGAIMAGEALGANDYYTCQSIWYTQPQKVYAINYQVGSRLAPGTRVNGVSLTNGRRPYFQFVTQAGIEFTIYINMGWHPGVSATDVFNHYFTKKPLREVASDMSQRELLFAQRGEVFVGMSKRAVLMAYGYPPEHVTPSTSANQWYYWHSKMGKKLLEFDNDGFVVNIRD